MTDALRRLAASVVLPGFTGTTVPDWLARGLDDGLAGVCLFGQNVADDAQVRALTDALHGRRAGVLVTADEEGGTVTRLEAATGSSWPGHATLGALDDPEATFAVAAGIGAHARRAGVDVVLAPVVDVNSEPDNPVIGVRSFGDDPALVARHGAAFVRGLQAAGVAACAKHYPGHGATRTDSHLALPFVDVDEQTFRARDLAPFVAAVAAGTRCVMTAHVVVRALDDRPATMSRPVLDVLRGELGFDGVVLSDALDMRAISDGVGRAEGGVRALAAGVDLLCIGNPVFPDPYDEAAAAGAVVDAVVAAVCAGRLPEERLAGASGRVGPLGADASDIGTAGVVPGSPLGSDVGMNGTAVAGRALRVRGDVRVDGDALVVVPRPPVGYAAGRRPSALVTLLRERRPAWPVTEVADGDEAAAVLAGPRDRDVLVVVEGRPDPALVARVLAAEPKAVVVYAGLARPEDAGERTVHAFGGGRATAEAVARLVLGGDR
ncbi:MAG: glycoside hydrolase family 3 protein [Nocardioidaceae bacterium]